MTRRSSILIAGVGSIGERHLRCFIASGRADVSFCDVNASLYRRIAEQYAATQSFDSFDSALAAKPDAVVICTPAHLHVSMALAAARAGAHLLIEKPLSTQLDGVAALEQEIVQRQRIAAVAYVYRAHPALAAMREAIHGGGLGQPVQIVATFGQHFPLYRPAYRETYYRDHATGGGAVQDALTHVINAGEWLVGAVDRLVADAAHQVLDGVNVEDTVHVLTRHGEVMGDFSLNQHQAPNEGTLTVICERGTARFEYHNARWRWTTEPGGDWHDEPVGPLERDTLFIRQAGSFLDSIAGLKPPLCTFAEATQTLKVNLAILSSVEKQSWQTIPAVEAAHA
jgi:predicted dehydrogenase